MQGTKGTTAQSKSFEQEKYEFQHRDELKPIASFEFSDNQDFEGRILKLAFQPNLPPQL